DVLALVHARAEIDEKRSHWGLWLAAVERFSDEESTKVDVALLRNCWGWLRKLLVDKDEGIADRPARSAQWTEHFAGLCLASMVDPALELEDSWAALRAQRLTVSTNRYSDDPWSTSRFLIRAACFAWHEVASDTQAERLWTCAIEMAVSA